MSKVLRPSLPFQTGIPGGIYDGKVIGIKGRIPFGAQRILIHLIAGYDVTADIALQIGIRFDQQCVVLRYHDKHNGEWGPEMRQRVFPFSFGREFTMMIAAQRNSYRIEVNYQHCWDFIHRFPMERVKSFSISGTVEVFEIEFIDKISSGAPSSQTPVLSRLPRVLNPSIPYAYPIYGGLQPGMTIYISGQPSRNPYRFTINLQKGSAQYPPPDVAFHFDPRFFNRSVVRNTRSHGVWAAEETYISYFPFQPGVRFNLIIRVEMDKYSVSINGQHFTDFRHRLRPLQIFDTLYIESDVIISSIEFS